MGQFGQELRRERMERGVSIDEICAITKVSTRHVQALEASSFEELPGGVFRKGIARSYIAAIGLEEAAWMERFEASLRENDAVGMGDADWTEFAENVGKSHGAKQTDSGMRWLGVLLMLFVLLVCGWLTWRFVPA